MTILCLSVTVQLTSVDNLAYVVVKPIQPWEHSEDKNTFDASSLVFLPGVNDMK